MAILIVLLATPIFWFAYHDQLMVFLALKLPAQFVPYSEAGVMLLYGALVAAVSLIWRWPRVYRGNEDWTNILSRVALIQRDVGAVLSIANDLAESHDRREATASPTPDLDTAMELIEKIRRMDTQRAVPVGPFAGSGSHPNVDRHPSVTAWASPSSVIHGGGAYPR